MGDGEKFSLGISLVVQWLGHHAANSRDLDSILSKGTRSHMLPTKRFSKPQLRPSTAKHIHTLRVSLV